MFHLNVCSLSKKFDNFEQLINQLQIEFDFVGIIESRLIKGINLTTNINLKDYVVEHTHIESSAGGTLLYINKKCSYQPRKDIIYKSCHLESIFVEIILEKKSDIITDCIYRNPSMDICTFNDHYLNPPYKNFRKKMIKKNYLKVILILIC